MTATVDTTDIAPARVATPGAPRTSWRGRIGPVLLALIFPACVLIAWEIATLSGKLKIVPPPYEVAVMMWDFAVGGIYDDAFSATLHIHLLESMRGVYAGFRLAALVADPST